jgi:hypothetical protein
VNILFQHFVVVFMMTGIYIKVADCCRRHCVICPCSYGRKKSIARQLQGQSGGGQIMANLNPSTDPLVCTQYAPVSEVPRLEDDEERKRLMNDKDCSAEESQLLGNDPRIVLKIPSTQHEDA